MLYLIGVVVLLALILIPVTWAAYLAVMNLERHEEMPKPARAVGYVVKVVGVLLDVALNLTATVFFLDLPREWLLTDRLERYVADPGMEKRGQVALWICHNFLDPFDPDGSHCDRNYIV